MGGYLGIDTSNYTTSAAVYKSVEEVVLQNRKLLPVGKGEKGLRQSDALFHHTVALPALVEEIFSGGTLDISAVGVSAFPRDTEGSYMPCFLAGLNAARCIAAAGNLPLYRFSHQAGHIAAAIYSAGKIHLIRECFIAFHFSGGTTEMLLVRADIEKILNIEIIGRTLDLNAGQAVDRIGLMLGLDFPCGPQFDKLALESKTDFSVKPIVTGGDCNLSGLENKCGTMFAGGESREDIAKYCIDYICAVLEKMARFALKKYGDLPLVFCGGVMSNSIIRQRISNEYGAIFAEPGFSSDNAAGIAVLAGIKSQRRQ